MARTGQKTAFVLAGGGSLGAMQVGMMDVLLAAGVQPDFVVGTSVGAINAAFRRSAECERRGEACENLVRRATERCFSVYLRQRIGPAQES